MGRSSLGVHPPARAESSTFWSRRTGAVCASTGRQRSLTEFPDRREPAAPALRAPQSGAWDESVGRFLEWKRGETAVGEEWLRRMRWELRRVPHLLEELSGPASVPEPSSLSFDQVRSLRARPGWSRATLALHFAALRQFLRWAGNPVAGRPSAWALPAGEPSRRRWLTADQLRKLYRRSSGAPRILVALEGLNGLRRVEVLRLRVRDIEFRDGVLNVRGKGRAGGKWRRIPMEDSVRRDLARYISGMEGDARVIPLSRSGGDQLLARAVASARLGPGVRVSHHDLRRTFGRLAYDAGADTLQIRHLLGHASSSMTEHYIGVDRSRMAEGLAKLSKHLTVPTSEAPPAGRPRAGRRRRHGAGNLET